MNQGVRGVHQRAVFVIGKAKTIAGDVAAKNAHARVQVFGEFGKLEMQLQRSPRPLARFLFGFRANQEIQCVAVPGEESRGDITAQVAGRAGYEDRHKESEGDAALESAASRTDSSDQSRARGSRDSSGRPSISG